MKVKIGNLSIERFRSLRQLKIEGLGRVNLITGRNNTGKSSILEALRILASNASPAVLGSILRYREEYFGEGEESGSSSDAESLSLVGSLFAGLPQVSESCAPIILAANGNEQAMNVAISFGRFFEQKEANGASRLVPKHAEFFSVGELVLALVIEANSSRRIISSESLRRFFYRGRVLRPDSADEPCLPCIVVTPYGGEHTANLGPLWDTIALTDREDDMVKALSIIDPDIVKISMVGGEGPRRLRTAMVRSKVFSHPVPLRFFGDGLNRLFGIVLSLVNAKDGLLLIDEFENGMHHTVQLDLWRAIFRLARQLNVQVFATSHSWDSIETFQKAAVEDPEVGVLVRLTRKGDAVIPTLFQEKELAVATRDRIEVR